MKTFKELLEKTMEKTFGNVVKNLNDEIKAYKSSKDDLEKLYTKVLRDIKKVVGDRKKLHNKEDTMSLKDFQEIVTDSKNFKNYDKDKMTDASDFDHIMD